MKHSKVRHGEQYTVLLVRKKNKILTNESNGRIQLLCQPLLKCATVVFASRFYYPRFAINSSPSVKILRISAQRLNFFLVLVLSLNFSFLKSKIE